MMTSTWRRMLIRKPSHQPDAVVSRTSIRYNEHNIKEPQVLAHLRFLYSVRFKSGRERSAAGMKPNRPHPLSIGRSICVYGTLSVLRVSQMRSSTRVPIHVHGHHLLTEDSRPPSKAVVRCTRRFYHIMEGATTSFAIICSCSGSQAPIMEEFELPSAIENEKVVDPFPTPIPPSSTSTSKITPLGVTCMITASRATSSGFPCA